MPKVSTMKLKIEKLQNKKLFNESKLKIKLPKFSGYESKLDIYSFKANF